MLYSKNAKVYIAARSQARAETAIENIRKSEPSSKGSLVFLHLDLADLTTIRRSADEFLSKEKSLHVLFNNAGLQSPNPTTTPQGYETHLGVNAIGTFLFTKFLTPILVSTAKTEPKNTVRVIWVSSQGAELVGEKNVGLHMDNLDYHIDKPPLYKYAMSKVGNYLHGVEFAKRYKADGVISVPLNPGNLGSDLYRDQTSFMFKIVGLVMYPPVNGAHTELFAGFSPDITLDNTGCWG